MNAALSAERRAQLLLARMTLEEKFWQLYMAPGDLARDGARLRHGAFGIQLTDTLGGASRAEAARRGVERSNTVQRFFVEQTRLGIPAILFEEGLHGVLQDGAPIYPQAIGLAATFDTSLMRRTAGEIGAEARARGLRLLLSPVVNLARDPRWGRVEETYGEDSWLSAAMGSAYVRAIEGAGVIATPKHFAINHGDGGRDSWPVGVDDATLHDLHLSPFRATVVDAGARAVMASYNSVNGLPATANPMLLRDVLRRQWGFAGVAIADAGAVGGANVLHRTTADYAVSTARAMRAGLDVIFQGGFDSAPLFWDAFRRGLIPAAVIDTAVVRVLRLKFALGLFEAPYATDAGRAAADASLSARVAQASLVLLHNPRGVLPLPSTTRRVAVIGDAATALPAGGYSARRLVPSSLVGALRERLPAGAELRLASGVDARTTAWRAIDSAAFGSGMRAEYFANPSLEGAPAHVRREHRVDYTWTFLPPAPGLGTAWYSVRWTGALQGPSEPGVSLEVEGDDGYRLWIDDSLAVDAWDKISYGVRSSRVALRVGASHALRLEYRQTAGPGRIRLLWRRAREATVERQMAEAADAARGAEVAVIVATIDEGEFRDRSSLRLPGEQEALIARVAATGTPVVVVLVAGGAVITTPWMHETAAVLWAPYPGDDGAAAIARTLLGESPAGRLPFTVPRSEGQLPLTYDHLPTGRGDDYADLTGQPLFPFGYGLGYSTFEYAALHLPQQAQSARDTVLVRFVLRNTGRVVSDEVPQLYIRHDGAPTAQPVLALRGVARVTLVPGESRDIVWRLPVAELAVRDLDGRRRVLPEQLTLFVGASSRDLRLRGTLQLK
ncbi:MAG: glycoside hydrolase family 3 N-terminal domain-containing protein [Gemmatimonadota bacterium]|nr:glycoside hydrolase family 3 N-terminal domain-containing protein [Gemmatimonadota bacterium]